MVKCSVSKSSIADRQLHMTIKSPGCISRQSNEENGVKELLGKLRSILPCAKDDFSTLDVMQHAIDYIQDLNDILAEDKSGSSEDEKENQHSFCHSDLYSELYTSEKQKPFNASCQNGLHPTAVF